MAQLPAGKGSSVSPTARRARLVVATLVGLALAAVLIAPGARAAFGDEFGFAEVNAPSVQDAPAFPGATAVWAGTCDLGGAPGFGEPIPGGVGARPDHVWTPTAFFTGEIPGDDWEVQQTAGPAPATPEGCIDWGGVGPYGHPDFPDLWRSGRTPSWRLAPVTQAGGHPDATTITWYRRNSQHFVDGTLDNVYVELPPGFVGDMTAVPACPAEVFAVKPLQCPPESQVGVIRLYLYGALGTNYSGSNEEILPVYNLEPRHRRVAELGFGNATNEDAVTVRIVAKPRTNRDFGVTAFTGQVPAALPLIASSVTIWGVPWEATNDKWRPPKGWRSSAIWTTGEIPLAGLDPDEQVSYDPSWGPIEPFLTNPSECSGEEPTTRLLVDSYENPGSFTPEGDPDLASPSGWQVADVPALPVTGCEKAPFAASFDPRPTSSVADSPSGLSVDLSIPQNDTPPFPAPGPGATDTEVDEYVTAASAHWRSDAGVATSHLEKAVVALPPGVAVNPSGATGLQGCSDAGMGLVQQGSPPRFDNDDPFDGKGHDCPKGSRIGTAEVDTPLLDAPLTGDVVLGEPRSTDPESGRMLRLFIVARDADRGLVAKIHGTTVVDAVTGRLTTTFDQSPRVPVENVHLELKGGPRGLLALPQACGNPAWASSFSPWSTAHGADEPVLGNGTFTIDRRCGQPFAPTLDAGMSPRQGGGSGTFTLSFARQDGEQWLRGVTVQVPQGLLANVGSVTLCTNEQANANACPLASKIGTADGAAGSGTPFVLEKKGSVYLTEGYKGAPYGLAVSVPVEAGPFTGQLALKTIVVRQALWVDPTTTRVTVESDPLPTIWHGIPLRVRSVLVKIDRPGFMRNPTDCSPKRIAAKFASTGGKTASAAEHFQVAGCGNLRFAPRHRMAFTGSRRQGRYLGHPGIGATLTQPPGQAGIKAATARLPKAVALDPDRVADASRQCEFEPSKTGNCPASSIVGRAKAVSPLLARPLEGPVYFAKNRRTNRFGRSVATLPSLVIALRGEVAINVRANSNAIPGKALVATFPDIPDAPLTRFELELKGGKAGILVVTRDARTGRKLSLCGRQVAELDLDAHNGKIHDSAVRMKTPCKRKAKRKPAKRRLRRGG